MLTDKQAIDHIVLEFFGAFANDGGVPSHIDCLYRLLTPNALITVASVNGVNTYDVRSFVEPRRALLTGGGLANFIEQEVAEQTEIHANIARRTSRYVKSWVANGETMRGSGIKLFHFVRTPEGWRICSLTWEDDAP